MSGYRFRDSQQKPAIQDEGSHKNTEEKNISFIFTAKSELLLC